MSKAAHPRRRYLRWMRNVALALAALIVLIVITLQIIFWTNLPRNLVVGLVQQSMGLHVTAGDLSTGFFGHTTLRNVTLALPLSDESFFHVDELKVNHTSIVGLLFKRTLQVQSVELDHPDVVVRQDPAGRWNVQQVAQLIARAGGSGNPQQKKSASVQLPELTISDGSIVIIANNGQRAELAPLNVHGESEKALTWKYNIAIGDQLKALGRVAPGGPFAHELEFSLHDVDQWIALFAPGFKHTIDATGTWKGQLAGGELTGRLDMDHAGFDRLTAKGSVSAAIGPTVEIKPEDLVLSMGSAPPVRLQGGVIQSLGQSFAVDHLKVAVAGGTASVSATYNPATHGLSAGVVWRNVAFPRAATHSGSLTLSLTEPVAGAPRIEATLASDGALGSATWDAAVHIVGEGPKYSDMNWTLSAERCALAVGRRNANLAGIVAKVAVHPGFIQLQSLSRPGSNGLTGFGQYSFADKKWYAWIDGTGPNLSGGDQKPLVFMADAWGAGSYYQLNQLYLRDSELEASGRGYYIGARPEPLFLNLSISQLENRAPVDPAIDEQPLIGGRIMGDIYVHGKADPSNIYLQGWLTGKNVVIADHKLGDLKIALDGTIDRDRTLRLATRELSLFDGNWDVSAVSPTPWDSTQIKVSVKDLPGKSVGKIVGNEDIRGLLAGTWVLDAKSFKRDDLQVRGQFSATDLAAGPFVADSVSGHTRLRNGNLHIDLAAAQSAGKANFTLASSLATLSQWKIDTTIDQWTTALSAHSRIVTSAQAQALVDLKAHSVQGRATLACQAQVADKPIGDAKIVASSAGRVLSIEKFNANLLGGSAVASATVDLDHPRLAAVNANWNQIDSKALVSLFPSLDGLTGNFSGLLVVAPDPSARPLAPLAAYVNLTPTDAHYRTLDIGALSARAAIEIGKTWRVVIDQARWNLAGGQMDLWARATRHISDDPVLRQKNRGDLVAMQANMRFRDIQLNPIVQAIKPGEKPMNALLNSEINLFADTSDKHSLAGTAQVSITHGKLVNFEPVRKLFEAMHVGHDDKPGKGYGAIAARIERGRLDVNQVNYFENGIEMRGIATVYDLYQRGQSPIKGWLIGTARPFHDLKIPFLADADDILNSLQAQSGISTVRIGGRVGDIKATPGLLADIGDAFKQIFTGDVRAEVGQ